MSAWSSSAQQSNQHQFLFLISDLHSTLQTVFGESPKRESSSWVFNSHCFIAFITNTVFIITSAVTTKALIQSLDRPGGSCWPSVWLSSLPQTTSSPTYSVSYRRWIEHRLVCMYITHPHHPWLLLSIHCFNFVFLLAAPRSNDGLPWGRALADPCAGEICQVHLK